MRLYCMTVLLIHHLQTCWDQSLFKISGKYSEEIATELVEFLSENHYDRVILTQFDNWQFEDMHHYSGLSQFVHECHEYGYGWEAEMFDDESDYIDGGNHSEVVYTPDWIKNLKGCEVHLCGAFDGECIEDMEIALSHCVGDFKRLEQFIV